MSVASGCAEVPGLPDGVEIASISPPPTADERSAIAMALATLWPQIHPQAIPPAVAEPSPRWRYAGRSWRRRQTYGGWA